MLGDTRSFAGVAGTRTQNSQGPAAIRSRTDFASSSPPASGWLLPGSDARSHLQCPDQLRHTTHRAWYGPVRTIGRKSPSADQGPVPLPEWRSAHGAGAVWAGMSASGRARAEEISGRYL